mgnify:CR=1 FL=1
MFITIGIVTIIFLVFSSSIGFSQMLNAEKYKMKEVDIINMIDVNIFHNQTSHFYYLLSKKSLAEFTRMLALEVSSIARVNGISPGFIFNLEGNDKNEESSPFVVNKILVKIANYY